MPNTPDEIDELIDTVAEGPASATVDGRSATAQKLSDLQAIRNDRASQEAASTAKFGLRFTRLVPPGCG